MNATLMPQHLFVYGTLKPGLSCALGAAERDRLAREATSLGPGTTSGVLIDLGEYPGLAPGNEVVHGTVYELKSPANTLKWLDEYEGRTGSIGDQYRREMRPVTVGGGTTIPCWTYVFIQFKVEAAVIRPGHWFPA